jgi:heme/copper-type cytochrome/quinol oxidase subunit 2
MPITVVAKTDAEYAAWANEAKTKFPVAGAAPAGAVKADATVPKQAAADEDPNKKAGQAIPPSEIKAARK